MALALRIPQHRSADKADLRGHLVSRRNAALTGLAAATVLVAWLVVGAVPVLIGAGVLLVAWLTVATSSGLGL